MDASVYFDLRDLPVLLDTACPCPPVEQPVRLLLWSVLRYKAYESQFTEQELDLLYRVAQLSSIVIVDLKETIRSWLEQYVSEDFMKTVPYYYVSEWLSQSKVEIWPHSWYMVKPKEGLLDFVATICKNKDDFLEKNVALLDYDLSPLSFDDLQYQLLDLKTSISDTLLENFLPLLLNENPQEISFPLFLQWQPIAEFTIPLVASRQWFLKSAIEMYFDRKLSAYPYDAWNTHLYPKGDYITLFFLEQLKKYVKIHPELKEEKTVLGCLSCLMDNDIETFRNNHIQKNINQAINVLNDMYDSQLKTEEDRFYFFVEQVVNAKLVAVAKEQNKKLAYIDRFNLLLAL